MSAFARNWMQIFLVASLVASAQAGTEVVWEETPTHRIKIKRVDGKEVGRWTFPRQKPRSRPGASSKPSALDIRQVSPQNAARIFAEASEEAAKAGREVLLVALGRDQDSAKVRGWLAQPGQRSRAEAAGWHLLVVDLGQPGLAEGPKMNRVLALGRWGVFPARRPVFLYLSRQGMVYKQDLPTVGFFGDVRMTEAMLEKALSRSPDDVGRAKLEQWVQAIEAGLQTPGWAGAKAIHENLKRLDARNYTRPEVQAWMGELAKRCAGKRDVHSITGNELWASVTAHWTKVGVDVMARAYVNTARAAAWRRDWPSAEKEAKSILAIGKKFPAWALQEAHLLRAKVALSRRPPSTEAARQHLLAGIPIDGDSALNKEMKALLAKLDGQRAGRGGAAEARRLEGERRQALREQMRNRRR